MESERISASVETSDGKSVYASSQRLDNGRPLEPFVIRRSAVTDFTRPFPVTPSFPAPVVSPDIIAISPDEKWLAVRGDGRNVFLLDARTGVVAHEIDPPPGPPPRRLLFSPRGDLLIVAYWRDETVAYDTQQWQPVWSIPQHYALTFSPDGQLCAGAEVNGPEVVVRDTTTAAIVSTLPGHPDSIMSMCVSPDNRLLASVDRLGFVKLWDLETGYEMMELVSESGNHKWLSFLPEGNGLLLVTSSDVPHPIRIYMWSVGGRTSGPP